MFYLENAVTVNVSLLFLGILSRWC